MSDWSSFDKDKAIADSWRFYLNEMTREEYLAYRREFLGPASIKATGSADDTTPDATPDATPEAPAAVSMRPLRDELVSAGISNSAINTIIRSIVQQLQHNGVPVTESTLNMIGEILIEKVSRSKRKKAKQSMRKTQEKGKASVKKLSDGEFTATRADGERKTFHQTTYGNNLKKAKAAAWAWSRGEEPKKKRGPPQAWLTQGGTQEEWGALGNKEKFVFLKMDPKKQRKFFKMSPEQRLEAYKQMKTGGPTKGSVGAEKTAAQQAALATQAKKRGLKPEKGTIKISTLNQQLQTINPPADQATRKKALSIAVKYLRPYLKQHQLKLSEQQIEVLAANILERATKLPERANEQ